MDKSIPSTFGAVFLGTCIAAVLTGVVSTQTLMYFRYYRRDGIPTKSMVFAVWLLDLFHTALLINSGWVFLIANFGNTDTDQIPPSFAISVVVMALTTIFVHGFFINRVYQLSRNPFIVAPMVVLGLLRIGSASATCIKMLEYGKTSLFLEKAKWAFVVGSATSLALDFWLTLTLLYYLWKSKTGFESVDSVIDKLSLYTLQSGLVTTIVITLAIGFWIGAPDNFVHLALYFSIGKLYANSLLVALNARDGIRNRYLRQEEIPMSSSQL